MLSPNYLYPHLSNKIISDAKYVVENHMRNNWAVSIEYTDSIEYLNTRWNKWGKTFFNVRSSSDIIDNIFLCHASNPLSAMRLHAEKFSPATRFDFPICWSKSDLENS